VYFFGREMPASVEIMLEVSTNSDARASASTHQPSDLPTRE
jgi:hypothetical protein